MLPEDVSGPVIVRWYWPDGDLWCYDELDENGWARRHIEVRTGTGEFVAAGSLDEWIEVRETGGVDAGIAYERRYGILPDAAFPEPSPGLDPPLELFDRTEFERLWREGRAFLGGA